MSINISNSKFEEMFIMIGKNIDDNVLADIILCEPITRKGRAALINLGLTTEIITEQYFFDNLRVPSKYENDEQFKEKSNRDDNCLYYQYTDDFFQFKKMQMRLEKFEENFSSSSPNNCPLIMLGVAGNGKSIEINRKTRNIESYKKVYLDLEESSDSILYGDIFEAPIKSPLWIFCVNLFDIIMLYFRNNNSLVKQIINNFNNIIMKENLATEKDIDFFNSINIDFKNALEEKKVFTKLKSFLSETEIEKNIKLLLRILMYILFCSSPNEKHYIIIDNIEQYIKLNDDKIQIPDSDISQMYSLINGTLRNVVHSFNRIKQDLGWKTFKIIIVLRRTSKSLLPPIFLHSNVNLEQNIADITGYFQVSDIWKEKKKCILKEHLKSYFDNEENKRIIKITDMVMNNGSMSTGTDYQSLIAPLMSYGLRRNAKSQAHSIFQLYKMLSEETTINYDNFLDIMDNANSNNQSVQYMFRRALIEIQFKWGITENERERWKKLGIGHISTRCSYNVDGKNIEIENVDYYNKGYITLVRRILIYLTYFPDINSYSNISRNKAVVDMYATISLYELINGVLKNPLNDNNIRDDDFLYLARVLIALSDMSFMDTKGAPYIFLGVNDDSYKKNPKERTLAKILKKIWDSGPDESDLDGEYNCNDFGVRITSAGCSFALDWQASFSFMAALYCHCIPPLFLLKDISVIKYVIKTVYEASLNLCAKYEEEAEKFCGTNVTLKTGKYLQRYENKYITFKQRVKELHKQHLSLYREYVEKNYSQLDLSSEDVFNLTEKGTGYINFYISKYNEWDIENGGKECF